MILIADSSSACTRWVVAEPSGKIALMGETAGINPYFQTRREISHIVRLGLPDAFFKHRWRHIVFYGPGCASAEKKKVLESSLVAQFRTPVEVQTNLVGAVRSLLGHEPGIACILSTGANSCFYDGENIVKNVTPGGYLLGDEGSNAYMGKALAADVIKGIAPERVCRAFFSKFALTKEAIIDMAYTDSKAHLLLAGWGAFLADHLDEPYCRKLVYDCLMDFFRRCISAYDYKSYPISVVGTTALLFRDVFVQAAADFGATVGKIEASSLDGLIRYHCAE